MTITLTPDLELAVLQKAHDQNITPEAVVLDALRMKLANAPEASAMNFEPRDDWERRLLSVGTACGVALSDDALSSEGLYD